ncbi:LacI family DNA-binding transcriptional regulator [Streptomyces smyrnaeus]|uniref:LacI family DNA-binding transcriptional regulator n=1 Tax=Streptomyces TaxID=1883 RepID=UPI000C19BA0B|nr:MULTISPECIES: LacI family DNA-binding transcriptional regulator [unclassified Streptomyces]MBQ0862187.1 LacI family DNA-binding transcriptional regulator [Streptomyces sp. RK75]MBQ1124303.1 LacI family DNA-binding transcriptional regulator [Streptomyces sp. B15]MBQ1158035.1 LacI family DNA-binding transcriptional regulator [Streptomyces sp. A73]
MAEDNPPRTAKARRGRPRQAEVARLAGVSQTTVSLVLGGNKQGIALHAETRARVLAAARELGYVPDPAARRLAASRNNLLGVFSFTATFPTAVEHSYYPFLVGVEQEAAARGFDLVLFTGSSPGGAQADVPGALERVRLADGCLLLGRHAPTAALRRLVEDGYPVVHIGRRDDLSDLAWVGADYVDAGVEVMRRLAALGHRRAVLVREDDDATASIDRERGFRTGLTAAGLAGPSGGADPVVRAVDPAAEITPDWVRERREEGVTAFVAEETDTGAVWRALLAAVDGAGLSAPDDLSLALLGSPPADLTDRPEPTGFDIPRTALGAAAVRVLTALLIGEKADEPLVACAFRSGTTTGPPPAAL